MTEIIIRELADPAEYKQVEGIQLTAWDRDERSIVPWEFMRSAQYSGGLLLGAFEPDQPGRLIGYVFAVFGVRENKVAPQTPLLQMYSHQLAVRPAYQGSAIGRRLKLAQRDFCLQRGVALVTWTFDPLMARNGWINIARLGGIVRTFLPDWYGENMHRFMLEWWLASDRVKQRIASKTEPPELEALLAGGALIANPAVFNHHGFPVPPAAIDLNAEGAVLLEIPADMPALVQSDSDLVDLWRSRVKKMFAHYLDAGFAITDLLKYKDNEERPREYYLLTKFEDNNEL